MKQTLLRFGAVVLLAGAVIGVVYFAWGCSRAASDLDTRQQAIQHCIMSGRHPFLGPDNSILCQ